MAAEYPSTIPTFTTKVDGTDYPSAAHVNKLQEESVATTTELGLLPKGVWATVRARLDDIQMVLNCYAADVGTAGSYWVACPCNGTIVKMSAVSYLANTTTKTVLTAEIGGTLVTAPAWEIGATAAAGIVSTVIPTATNTVTAGQAIEIISDGGSATAGQATMFSITILRTS